MKSFAVLTLFASGLALGPNLRAAPSQGVLQPVPPPPAPPVEIGGMEPHEGGHMRAFGTLYSIGNPTAEEQLYVEMINRARANPSGEGSLLAGITDPLIVQAYTSFGVDLDVMLSQFASIAPAPPLAISASLTAAARRHTQDMFDNAFQDHPGSDGSSPAQRVTDAGYKFSMTGENVYSYAESVSYGHAGFEVDWGPGPYGMQSPAGHRGNIHRSTFREIGVGVVLGRNQVEGKRAVGPQLVTQEFASAQGSTPFITGVAYYDLNGNHFYDVGEGIGGVSVTVSESSYEAVTALSGGYTIPVPGDGQYTITFSGPGFTPSTRTVTVSNLENRKVDYTPAYTPPAVSGSSVPAIQRPNIYSVTAVGGASAYQWRVFQKEPAVLEGAERGSATVSITQTGTYSPIESVVKKSGSYAFHLVTPESGPRSQYVRLLPVYLAGTNSSLTFQSRLAWAGSDQHAQVQVSTNAGATWEVVYDQAGTGTQGETTFNSRTVNLSRFAGQFIQVQFVYSFILGEFFDQVETDVGWVFDDIQLANTSEITNEQIHDFAGGSFEFMPATLASYSLQVRARTGHEFLMWGPAFSLRATQPTGTTQVALDQITPSNGGLEIEFAIKAGATPSNFIFESTSEVGGEWMEESISAEELGNARYRIHVTSSGARRFFRVKAAN